MPVFVRILAALGVTLFVPAGAFGGSGWRKAGLPWALEGVPDTAMLPLAGFSELGDADAAAAVRLHVVDPQALDS